PVESRPAPTAANRVDQAFPAADDSDPPEVVSGPLHVVRHQPDGDVGIAPFVTITFDQPMVAVGTSGPLRPAEVPVTITPAVEGAWQWIGTRPLRFDASVAGIDRLPMATEYAVVVPAGTTSATGNALEADYSFRFNTPPASVQSFWPSTGDDTQITPTQLFLAAFDQRVDAEAVVAHATISAKGNSYPLRVATAAEVAADETVSRLVADAPDGRWVAFRAVDPLPLDTRFTVTFGTGLPSAEGPRPSTAEQSFRVQTYGPLTLRKASCDWGNSECRPGSSLVFEFTNELDAKRFDPATVSIEPAIPGAVVGVSGSALTVWGGTAGSTTYTVSVPAGLVDIYGQTLAEGVSKAFEIGPAQPALRDFASPLVTIDPNAPKPHVDIVTVNHDSVDVSVFAVQPGDWGAFAQYLMNEVYSYRPDRTLPDPSFTRLAQRTVAIDNQPDRATITSIDLSQELTAPTGHVVVLVRPSASAGNSGTDYDNMARVAWVQATQLNVDAFFDQRNLVAWTTELTTGSPVADVAVQVLDGYGAVKVDPATTDGEGLARFTLPVTDDVRESRELPTVLVATKGDDTALLPSADSAWGGGWWGGRQDDQALWYVVDDRQVYQPGETVSVSGWVRRFTTASDAQVVRVPASATVTWQAHDGQGNTIADGTATLNPLGAFSLQFDVPADSNLGYASINLALNGAPSLPFASTGHQFRIEQYRRPEFEVSARPESAEPHVVGTPLTVAVDAAYYAGGPLPDAPVTWNVTTNGATYVPPGWERYTFGRWTPWWRSPYGGRSTPAIDDSCCWDNPTTTATFTGRTNGAGSDYLQIDVSGLAPDQAGYPIAVRTQASVTDVNRQAWAANTTQVVHPGEVYVGLAGEQTFVELGQPIEVDAVAVGIDGGVAAGRTITITATRQTTVFRNGRYETTDADPQVCTVTSAAEPVRCSFDTPLPGSYTVRAEVADAAGRISRSEITRWVSGADHTSIDRVRGEQLTLVPDADTYAAGSTARLLVQSPVAEGTGLLVVSRNGIRSTDTFTVTGGSAVVEVPLADRDIPSVDVVIEVAGTSPRNDDGSVTRPAYATGQITLPISLASRTLTVAATPHDAVTEPGATTAVDVTVTDAAGKPVAGADFTVMVVDEAVLALSGTSLADPLASFYPGLYSWVSTRFGRDHVALVDLATLTNVSPDGQTTADSGVVATTTAPAATVFESAAEQSVDTAGGATGAPPPNASRQSAGDGDDSFAQYKVSADGSPIDVRANFTPIAVFAPSQTTGANGSATIQVPLPDSVTRYRVMVVAAAGDAQFGSTTASVTARLALTVRPSAPRFANFGDTFELPVVLQNQTDGTLAVDVALQTDNLATTGPAGLRVEVPANNRVEVRFGVGTEAVGTARFRIAAASGQLADAATVTLPVYTPATAEAFATYGVIDGTGSVTATAQPIESPTDVFAQFGGLEVSTSSTALAALTDAAIAVTDYPYNSSDAAASRILTIVALRDVLDAFGSPNLPSRAKLDAAINADIARITALQNGDGGFAYWERGKDSSPFNSVHALHALLLARDAGYSVQRGTIDSALWYLQAIEGALHDYSADARDSVIAYALFTRDLADDRDASRAEQLVTSRNDLPLDALAWAWPVVDSDSVSRRIATTVANRAVDTAATVNFVTAPSDSDVLTLRSDRRTDALVLDSLIREQPTSDMIPKVVAGLLAGQRTGRNGGQWDGIQENTFILLALHRYFATYEGTDPAFVASVWLGDRFAGSHEFTGRSTDQVTVVVPTAALIEQLGTTDDDMLTIANDGAGRLYYRIAMRTAPTDLDLDPLDRGFTVSRTYEAVDDPADVSQDTDGTWRIRAGARVRVRVTMVAESQRAHVALIDPLAAGTEILNPDFATTPDLPQDDNGGVTPYPIDTFDAYGGSAARGWYDWFWRSTWYDHQNRRDDRAEAFATWLSAGVYDYSYVVSATT
ncbi:MAG TPA: alpha-2-macroglobulin family protein, partial [Ilumatobacteraceae bacterium]|nr:alpha-2-macroglobulin family protein [Ilumatobacteraceae bacterium]